MKEQKICEFCRKPYEATRKTQKYCQQSCCYKAWNENNPRTRKQPETAEQK